MIYEEQTAVEIIKAHELNKKIKAVWKMRGRIPDRYLNEVSLPKLKSVLDDLQESGYISRYEFAK
jgi:hypothetical protein